MTGQASQHQKKVMSMLCRGKEILQTPEYGLGR